MNYLSKLFVPKRVIHTIDKKKTLLVFLFLTEIRSCLQKYFKNYIPYCSLKMVYQPKNRFVDVFNFKDVLNTMLSPHIVYKFMCPCCNTFYYGQTLRHYFVKTSGHVSITSFTSKFVKTPKKSAHIHHMLLDGHKASFNDYSILLKENNTLELQ